MATKELYEVEKNHPIPFCSGMKLSVFGPFGVVDFFAFVFVSLLLIGLSAILPPLPIGGSLKGLIGRVYISFPILILFFFFIAKDGETKQPLYKTLILRYKYRIPKTYKREG